MVKRRFIVEMEVANDWFRLDDSRPEMFILQAVLNASMRTGQLHASRRIIHHPLRVFEQHDGKGDFILSAQTKKHTGLDRYFADVQTDKLILDANEKARKEFYDKLFPPKKAPKVLMRKRLKQRVWNDLKAHPFHVLFIPSGTSTDQRILSNTASGYFDESYLTGDIEAKDVRRAVFKTKQEADSFRDKHGGTRMNFSEIGRRE